MAVVAYHLDFGFLSGGFLGVDLFFVLSGFLITSLLVEEHGATGAVALVTFWGRRAKRLLPALFAMLAIVFIYVAVVGHFDLFGGVSISLSSLRRDGIATIFYVANWNLIFEHQSYFAQFMAPSPIQHTWSLAIEEQFYLLFPFAAVGLLARPASKLRRFAWLVMAVLAAASAIEMALLFHPGTDPSRVYYGTDTRAFDLLIGAAVAFATAGRGPLPERIGRRLELAAWPAAFILAVFWVIAGTHGQLPRDFMYRGGFLLCALLAAVIIAAAALRPSSLAARAVALKPLVAIGVVSYGVYLWHWPVIILINPSSTGLTRWPLDIFRIALIAVLTELSYVLLERPLRRRAYSRRQSRIILPVSFASMIVVLVVMTAPSVALAPVLPPSPTSPVVGTGPFKTIPGSGGYGSQQRISLGRLIDPAHPLRVGFFGDSLVAESYLGLAAALRSTGEVTTSSTAVAGWGLTSQTNNPFLQLRQFRYFHNPEIYIGAWGWDNAAAAKDPVGYQQMLQRAIDTLTKGSGGGSGVLLLTFPTPGTIPFFYQPSARANFDDAANIAAWDAAAHKAAADNPGRVMVLPVTDSVLLPGRQYTAWLPPGSAPRAPYDNWVRVRKTDGVHLCQNGTVRVATALATDLQQLVGLGPMRGKWWTGPWSSEALYNEPKLDSTCPGDHPMGPAPPAAKLLPR